MNIENRLAKLEQQMSPKAVTKFVIVTEDGDGLNQGFGGGVEKPLSRPEYEALKKQFNVILVRFIRSPNGIESCTI
jgi:ABC-type amino acid transport substrate-binding protein